MGTRNNRRRARRRRKLWERDRRCYWCGRETVLVCRPEGVGMHQMPRLPNEATLDHLATRFDGRVSNANRVMTVLACSECNHRRGAERERQVPLEELHRRAGNGGTNRERRPSDLADAVRTVGTREP